MESSRAHLLFPPPPASGTDSWTLPLRSLASMATVGNSLASPIVLPSGETCLFSLAAFDVVRDGFLFQVYPVWYHFYISSK